MILYFKLSYMSTLHLTSYIVTVLCAASPLVVSTVTEYISTSQNFSLASVSFISMLVTAVSSVKQETEDVYAGGKSAGGLWHYCALHHAQSLIAITNQIWGNNLPTDMNLQALIVFHIRLSNINTLRIQVFGMWCCSVGWVVSDIPDRPSRVLNFDCMTYEDGGTMILWNPGKHSPNGTAPYLRRLDSSAASL